MAAHEGEHWGKQSEHENFMAPGVVIGDNDISLEQCGNMGGGMGKCDG